MLASMENRVRRWLYGRDLAVWYAPEYRWPLSALEARTGFQTRRAAFALWYLLERRALGRRNLRRRRRAEYQELARVHTPELLDSLGRPDTLARVFSVDPSDVPVDEVMSSVRLVCGATIAAAREMLSGAGPRRGISRGARRAPGARAARGAGVRARGRRRAGRRSGRPARAFPRRVPGARPARGGRIGSRAFGLASCRRVHARRLEGAGRDRSRARAQEPVADRARLRSAGRQVLRHLAHARSPGPGRGDDGDGRRRRAARNRHAAPAPAARVL